MHCTFSFLSFKWSFHRLPERTFSIQLSKIFCNSPKVYKLIFWDVLSFTHLSKNFRCFYSDSMLRNISYEPSFSPVNSMEKLSFFDIKRSLSETLFFPIYGVWAENNNTPCDIILNQLVQVDDDSYVILENLRYFLSHYDTSKPLYFGKRFKTWGDYMAGGPGYVLSRESLKRVVTAFRWKNESCPGANESKAEDVLMGQLS